MKRLSAVDALGRGTANVRANPELIAVAAAGSVAIVAIVVASFLPWIAVLGIDPSWFSSESPDPEKLTELLGKLGSIDQWIARLGGFLLSFSLALTLASLLFCWYQGGLLGVLVAGDAQAPAGGGREPVLFRTWSRGLFFFEARRLTWRLFWFYTLFFTIWSLLGALTLAIFVAAGLLGDNTSLAAGCAIACGVLLPLLFVSFALYAAMLFGQAEIVRPESGVTAATRAAFSILGRRIGAAAALVAILFVLSLGLGIVMALVGAVGEMALASLPVFDFVFRALLLLVQIVCSGVIGLITNGAFAALARSESAIPEPG